MSTEALSADELRDRLQRAEDARERAELLDRLARLEGFDVALAAWDPHGDAEVQSTILWLCLDVGGKRGIDLLQRVVADGSLDPRLRAQAYSRLDEGCRVGRAARYKRDIDEACAKVDAAEQERWSREEAQRLREQVAASGPPESVGVPPRVFRHPDGRAWKVRVLEGGRVLQMWIVLADGEVIERKRACERRARVARRGASGRRLRRVRPTVRRGRRGCAAAGGIRSSLYESELSGRVFESAKPDEYREDRSPCLWREHRSRRGAGHGIRTRDIQLGKLALYQLS